MGEPLKLIDLAKYIIDNYTDNNTVEIKITGLRPGEKHDEDIISENELIVATPDNDILLVIQKNTKKLKEIDFDGLQSVTPYLSPQEIKNLLISYI